MIVQGLAFFVIITIPIATLYSTYIVIIITRVYTYMYACECSERSNQCSPRIASCSLSTEGVAAVLYSVFQVNLPLLGYFFFWHL